MNKTDVETLRASFGVRPLSLFLAHFPLTCIYPGQSFAKISQASTAQLTLLPGFGPKKVARLKDAFEGPFRTGTAGDALPAPASTVSASASAPATAAPSARSTDC